MKRQLIAGLCLVVILLNTSCAKSDNEKIKEENRPSEQTVENTDVPTEIDEGKKVSEPVDDPPTSDNSTNELITPLEPVQSTPQAEILDAVDAPGMLSAALFGGELRIVVESDSETQIIVLSAADAKAFWQDFGLDHYIIADEGGDLNPFDMNGAVQKQGFIRLVSLQLGSNTLYLYKDYTLAVFNGFDYDPAAVYYYKAPSDAYVTTLSLIDRYKDKNIDTQPGGVPDAPTK